MPTIVGILTFISMINTTAERLKARNFFICRYFSIYEQLKFRAQLSEHEKGFITSGPGLNGAYKVDICEKNNFEIRNQMYSKELNDTAQIKTVFRLLVKSVYQKKNIFLISQPKCMLWVLNETVLLSTKNICYN